MDTSFRPVILPRPPAPDPATDPVVRPAPFTLLPAHSPAHVLTSMYAMLFTLEKPAALSLSDRMNGHRFTTTVSNPDLPVAIHTQSHQITFQDCWSVSIIHKLPDSTPDHICRHFEIAYQLLLQSYHTPGLNIC